MSVKVEDKLFLNRYRVDEESHLRIIDYTLCLKEIERRVALRCQSSDDSQSEPFAAVFGNE